MTNVRPTPEYTCPFCEIIAGRAPARVVAENHEAIALLPLKEAARGHTLVVPKLHLGTIFEYFGHELHATTDLITDVSTALNDILKPDGMNIIQSNGSAASQTVWHVHFHLVPRYDNDAMGWFWPRSYTREPDYLDYLASAIREAM